MTTRALTLISVVFLFAAASEAFETDNRYEILDQLEESFRSVRGEKWVNDEPKDQLMLAQKLFEMKSTDEGLFPAEAQKHMDQKQLDFLRDADDEMQGWLPEDRTFIREGIHRQVVDELLKRVNSEKRVFFSIRGGLLNISNITQTPDSVVAVSNRSGTLLNANASVKFTGRNEPFGKPTISLDHSISQFLDKEFSDRDYKSISTSLSDKLIIRKSGISFMTAGVDIRGDYLRTFGDYGYASTTYVPKLEVMLAPSTPKDGARMKRLSDLFFTFFTLGNEVRDYKGSQQIDPISGRRKDSSTPFLTLILLNLKTWKSHPSRATLSLMLRNQNSDSDEFTYNYYRLGLGYAIPWPRWSIGADISYMIRDQRMYQSVARKDAAWEPRLTISAKLYKEILSLNLFYSEVRQSSNRNNYGYLSRQASAGISCNF